jgi:uncharacterized protein with FMN-binding domain
LLFWHGKRKDTMSKPRPSDTPRTIQTIKKLALSTFVVGTFAAYAVHENREGANAVNGLNLPTSSSLAGAAAQPQNNAAQNNGTIQNTNNVAQSGVPVQNNAQTNNNFNTQPQQQQPPQPQQQAPRRSGLYQDGQYAGPVTNAYYGNVQVEAIIQNGKLADVQWLDYPHDRRTSLWINQQATPWLRQEAIQAQSANVNIISGATLTSEAFIQSLQVALNQAKG